MSIDDDHSTVPSSQGSILITMYSIHDCTESTEKNEFSITGQGRDQSTKLCITHGSNLTNAINWRGPPPPPKTLRTENHDFQHARSRVSISRLGQPPAAKPCMQLDDDYSSVPSSQGIDLIIFMLHSRLNKIHGENPIVEFFDLETGKS